MHDEMNPPNTRTCSHSNCDSHDRKIMIDLLINSLPAGCHLIFVYNHMMGVAVSKRVVTDEEKQRHMAAEQLITQQKLKNEKNFNMLLLGAGDSGKSTIVKQMRILHTNGFDRTELFQQRVLIAGNVLHSITAILNAMLQFNMRLENVELEKDADNVLDMEKAWHHNQMLSQDDWKKLHKLWKDRGLQMCFKRGNEFQLNDSTAYFCNDMERISALDYVPSEQDMLRSRVPTTGIVEIEIPFRGLILKIIDVGGQRSQRKKWIHCFQNIDAMIFVASLSEYNQVLLEDSGMNRMKESMKLFSTVINSQWFCETSVVLFLNKKDIFEEKLSIFPLSDTFPKYKGGADVENAHTFIKAVFESLNQNPEKSIYTHRTCATDTRNVQFVMESCIDILLKTGLSRSGLI